MENFRIDFGNWRVNFVDDSVVICGLDLTEAS